MPETITVAVDGDRVDVDDVARTEREYDGRLILYDSAGQEIGDFPPGSWAVVADNLDG